MKNQEEILEFFNGDALAAQVWNSKYRQGDELPNDSINRELKELHRINTQLGTIPGFEDLSKYLSHYSILSTGGSFKAGIGTNAPVSLSNCFVVRSPKDSIGGIKRTEEEIEQICKRRGGVGTDISTIRPNGALVNNAAKSSTGVVSVAEKFSNCIMYICQAGRRGALMISLDYRHPDVMEFVTAKMDLQKITGANISVRINGQDLFGRSERDEDLILRFPIDARIPEDSTYYDQFEYGQLVEITDKVYIKKIKAKDLEDLIAKSAWKSAEPGLLFWDTIENESIGKAYPKEDLLPRSTNPCGEIPIPPYDSCRLCSLNWMSFIDHPFTSNAQVNSEKLEEYATAGIIVLDNIVELELEHVSRIIEVAESGPETDLWNQIYKVGQRYRRLGLGPNGVADALAALGFKYDSEEAITTATAIQRQIACAALKASNMLAKIRGNLSFIDYKSELANSKFIARMSNALPEEVIAFRRNINLLTAAPNGTNAMMQQCSSGIEPVFKVVMNRAVVVNPGDNVPEHRIVILDGIQKYIQRTIAPGFVKWYMITHDKTEQDAREYLENCPEDELNDLVKLSPYFGSTAEEINPMMKVRLQGGMQKYIDHSISVTHNLPKGTTANTIKELYRSAYDEGCKGVTVYVDGSRTGVLDVKAPEQLKKKSFKRPKELYCRIVRFRVYGEPWFGFVSEKEGMPFEIFTAPENNLPVPIPDEVVSGKIVKDKALIPEEDDIPVGTYKLIINDKEGNPIEVGDVSRMCIKEYFNYGRLMSGLLRHEMPIESLISTLEHLKFDNDGVTSWKMGVIRAFKSYLKDGATDRKCPNCGSKMRRESGCYTCDNCGNSLCG